MACAHGSIAQYQRASVEHFCSSKPPQSNDDRLLKYDCNEMLRLLFRQECVNLVLVTFASAFHCSYPRRSLRFPVFGCLAGFLAYFSPQFSIFMNPLDEVNEARTLFNLYGIVSILCLMVSIMSALNMQAHFKRQSLDWFLGSYMHQTMRSRRGKEA